MLPGLVWMFSWFCGPAAPYLRKHGSCAYSWFHERETAFLRLSCYPLAYRNMGVLAKENLLVAMKVYPLVFRW